MILSALLLAAVTSAPVSLTNGPALQTRSLFAEAARPAPAAVEHKPGVDGAQAFTAGLAMLPFDIGAALVSGTGFLVVQVFGLTGMFAPISALALTFSVGVIALDMIIRPFIGAAGAVAFRSGSYPLGVLAGLGAQAVAAALGAAIFWFPAAMVPLAIASLLTTFIAVPAAISFGVNVEPPAPRRPAASAAVAAFGDAPPGQVRFTF